MQSRIPPRYICIGYGQAPSRLRISAPPRSCDMSPTLNSMSTDLKGDGGRRFPSFLDALVVIFIVMNVRDGRVICHLTAGTVLSKGIAIPVVLLRLGNGACLRGVLTGASQDHAHGSRCLAPRTGDSPSSLEAPRYPVLSRKKGRRKCHRPVTMLQC